MSTNLKISILIPSFNQGAFIEQTILSILNQDHTNTELIIIDGGSTDNTVDIIKKYEDKIAYWISEPDRGQAHAINKGLEKATGKVFNWINSDDYLEPGALNLIANYFTINPTKNICCGYTRCFYNDDNSTSHEYRMGVKEKVADTIYKVEMNQPGSFYKMQVLREFCGVNESLRYVFDDELWFRYLCKYGLENIGFIDKRIASFRLHRNSKSVGEGFDHFNKEIQSLHIDIALAAGAPNWLIEKLQTTAYAENYIAKEAWDIKKLEQQRLLALLAAKFINSLYLAGEKKQAKEAMQMTIDNNVFKWNRMNSSLRLKLLFS